ncbi:MAG: transcriptional repressor LexA [Oscillospiraceae bacterium]|nr:transcriptional repressor LexA [Oscillospiraceae bacterium]
MEHKKMQMQIYRYIVDCVKAQGYPPSVREIGLAVGLKSPSTVHFHLKNLEEAGYIEKGAGKGRALRPIKDIGEVGAQRTEPVKKQEKITAIGDEAEPTEDRVPIVGNVAAGSPILAQECIEDYLTFDTGGDASQYFALRVRGLSMKNAGILPGDLVIVKKQQDAHNGQIVVALIGEEATVKRFSRENGEIWLLPENEDFDPIDGTEAVILGRVTAVVRQY